MTDIIKQITVNNATYEFFFNEEGNKWRMPENSSLIDNQTIDVEIELTTINEPVNWKNVISFFQFLTWKRYMTNEHLERARSVCKAFFNATHPSAPDDVSFKLLAIYFKAHIDSYTYDYLFGPQYDKNTYSDLSPVQYRANFRGIIFLGVSLDETI